MMSFVLEMMKSVLEMINFVLTMMIITGKRRGSTCAAAVVGYTGRVLHILWPLSSSIFY